MVKVYAALIRKGIKKIGEVPKEIRQEVRETLRAE